MIMNLCIFGAVALGPFIGGLQAEANAWRPLFWIVAGISVAALLLAVLTFDDAPPANLDSPRDLPAIALATVGCVAAFFGAAQLTTHRLLDPVVIVPMVGGLATIVVLVVYEYRAKRPLLTIRTMMTSSIPVAGVTLALFAAAASVSATALTVEVLTGHYSPLRIGVLFLPEVGGAVVTAIVLGLVLQRRAIHYLPLVGMIVLAAGIAVFRVEVPPSQALTLVGSSLTGIGLGATVAPALFVAGFSLASANLQRVFAIVELLRAMAAFMLAPIFVYFASTISGSLDEGTGIMLLVGIGLAIAGAAFGVAIYVLSGARPQTPDLDTFLQHGAGMGLAASAGQTWLRPCSRSPRYRKASTDIASPGSAELIGPVLFAYDGSELAGLAIDRAALVLARGEDALVLCVWQPVDVGFTPANERHFDADQASEVRRAAEETAAYGASLAKKAGFGVTEGVEAAPTWKGIVEAAAEHQVSLIVLGSHRHGGLVGHFHGNVAAAVIAHGRFSVLVVHPPP